MNAPHSGDRFEPDQLHQAETPGSVPAREGRSHYEAGDYIVSNTSDDSHQYATSAEKFESLYMPDDEEERSS